MEQYDVMCPICGTLNKGLFLDETGGWIQAKKNTDIARTGIFTKTPTQKGLLSSAEYLYGLFLLSHGDILYICNLESSLFSRIFKDILENGDSTVDSFQSKPGLCRTSCQQQISGKLLHLAA